MLGVLEKTIWGLTILVLIGLGAALFLIGLPSTTPSIAMESELITEDQLKKGLNQDQQNRLNVAIGGLDRNDETGELVPRNDGRRPSQKTVYRVDEDLFDRMSNLNDCVSELKFASSEVQEDGTLKIFDIQEGSLLEKVGLLENDVLERVEGLKIDFGSVAECRDSWQACLQKMEVGDPIVIEIKRKGVRHHLIVSPSF